jgi:hypothetical protein
MAFQNLQQEIGKYLSVTDSFICHWNCAVRSLNVSPSGDWPLHCRSLNALRVAYLMTVTSQSFRRNLLFFAMSVIRHSKRGTSGWIFWPRKDWRWPTTCQEITCRVSVRDYVFEYMLLLDIYVVGSWKIQGKKLKTWKGKSGSVFHAIAWRNRKAI